MIYNPYVSYYFIYYFAYIVVFYAGVQTIYTNMYANNHNSDKVVKIGEYILHA